MKATLLVVAFLGFAAAQNTFTTSRKVVVNDGSFKRPQYFPNSGDGVYRKNYKPVVYKTVNEGSYQGANDGRYVSDNSGSYKNNDGRYYPDNGGKYVHIDPGYKHDDQGYKHLDQQYANDAEKYKQTGDKFGNGGTGAGIGAGFDVQNKKPVVITVVADTVTKVGGDNGQNKFGVAEDHSNEGRVKVVGQGKFGSGQQVGQGKFGSGQQVGQFGSLNGYGAQVALEQGSASGKYENKFYNTIRREQHAEEDGYHYLYETENGILAEEQGRLENRNTDDEGMRAHGFYTYTGPDNIVYTVRYTADENGFVPEGAHIPTPPPVPAAIVRALEYQRSIGTL